MEDEAEKPAKRWWQKKRYFLLIAFFGYTIGWLSPPFDIKSKTYFEANEIAHYLYKHKPEDFAIADVYDGDWKLVCLGGQGTDVIHHFSRNYYQPFKHSSDFKPDDKFTFIGTNVDEGLLQYIFKIVLINDQKQVYINNFDDRLFWFENWLENDCIAADKLQIKVSYKNSSRNKIYLKFENLN